LNVIPEGTPGDRGIIVFVVTLEGLTPRRCGAPEEMCLNIVIRDLSILFNVRHSPPAGNFSEVAELSHRVMEWFVAGLYSDIAALLS
jgi:hypothetical protein